MLTIQKVLTKWYKPTDAKLGLGEVFPHFWWGRAFEVERKFAPDGVRMLFMGADPISYPRSPSMDYGAERATGIAFEMDGTTEIGVQKKMSNHYQIDCFNPPPGVAFVNAVRTIFSRSNSFEHNQFFHDWMQYTMAFSDACKNCVEVKLPDPPDLRYFAAGMFNHASQSNPVKFICNYSVHQDVSLATYSGKHRLTRITHPARFDEKVKYKDAKDVPFALGKRAYSRRMVCTALKILKVQSQPTEVPDVGELGLGGESSSG
jgi:hypothetical protein